MKRNYEFSISTRYVGSEVKEEIEIEFDDGISEEQINHIVDDYWINWRDNNMDGGWELIKSVNLK
jgi:hypothetical protein